MTPIRLLISDVDGTLVTSNKQLTSNTIRAVQELRASEIAFSITSSRPPFGMRMLIEPLALDLPIGPFNGTSIVDVALNVIEQHTIPRDAVIKSIALFDRYGIDRWLFTNQRWIAKRDDGHYLAHEQKRSQPNP
jgi:HAD superfamily hydrolase (TIGR01484 family)